MSDNIINSDSPAVAESATTEASVDTKATEIAQNNTLETPVETPVESPAVTNVDFIETISEDLRAQGNLKDFKDVNHLAKSYVELQRMVGNSVRVPAEDASAEAKQDFYDKIKDVEGILLKSDEKLLNKLGKPESAEDYKLEDLVSSELLNTVPSLGEEIADFKNIAHEAGLTNEQASKLVEMRMETIKSQEDAFNEKRTSGEAELRKMWGEDYDNRLSAAKQVAKIYGEKHGEHINELINSAAGNNPAFLNMLSELGSVYKEKSHEGMSTAQFGITPEIALQKISDKRADRGFLEAYQDDRHPGHKKAVAELQHLYKVANGA